MSLKDQMVKAGLVSAKQARKVAHTERVERKSSPAEAAGRASKALVEEVQREQEAQRERDRQLNLSRQAQQAEQERRLQERDRHAAAIASALRDGRLEHWGGNRTYHFTDGTRVETLAVSDDAAMRLQEGRAAIVRTGDPTSPYTLLHSPHALRLNEIEPGRLVILHGQ